MSLTEMTTVPQMQAARDPRLETTVVPESRPWRIAVLRGDGIGPEVIAEALKVLRAVAEKTPGLHLQFEEHSAGAVEFLRQGNPLPDNVIEACRQADAILLGAMGLPSVRWPDGRELTPQIDLREQLDLYAGLRPLRLYHERDTPLKGLGAGAIDLVIVRENCEGLFSARLSQVNPASGEVTDTLRITRRGAERICRAAFQLARQRRRRCTLVDKANVLPSMVFFRSIFEEVGREYPEVERDHVYVDAMALHLLRQPGRFDVVVTENMFGDILSDMGAGLVGGMGMAPSADIGEQRAVFQPAHGTAPDIAGKGIANPVAAILSAALLLEWLKQPETRQAADRVRQAVEMVLADPANRTPDLGGNLTTTRMGDLIAARV